MSNLIEVQPEYVYTTIPREYVDVYHRILAMLSDYGEDMLKDCKASCTERNSGVIECFNMFNSAIAARKLGNTKLAETIIKYVKAKIEMIYKGKNNDTSFIYPLDEYGELNAIVSSGNPIKFEIDADKGNLYLLKFANGFKSWYDLSKIENINIDNTPKGSNWELCSIFGGYQLQLEFTYKYDNFDVSNDTLEYVNTQLTDVNNGSLSIDDVILNDITELQINITSLQINNEEISLDEVNYEPEYWYNTPNRIIVNIYSDVIRNICNNPGIYDINLTYQYLKVPVSIIADNMKIPNNDNFDYSKYIITRNINKNILINQFIET
jgi:hypothetical protein